MAVCDPTISSIVHGGAGTLDNSITETIITDNGSDTSTALSIEKNLDPTNEMHNRNGLVMKNGVFESCKYSNPHIRMDETTMDLIVEEDKLMTKANERADARNSLENQMLAVALMKSVVETSCRQNDKVTSASQVKMGTNGAIDNGCHSSTTESRVGVTLSCTNLPTAGNGVTNLMECEESKNYMKSPHVVDDIPLSPRNGDMDSPTYSGVYCGTRKRKRDALHPDSPCSMELSPTGCDARSRVWKENDIPDVSTQSVTLSSLGNNHGLRACVDKSQKPPDVTNSQVPNPILGSPFKIEETDDRVSGGATADMLRQIPTSDLNQITSLVGGKNNLSSVKVEAGVVSNNVAIDSNSLQYSPKSLSIAPKCSSLPEACPVKREEVSTVPSNNNSGAVSFVFQNHEGNSEPKPIVPRRRIFSVDLNPDVFDFDTCIGITMDSPSNGILESPPAVHYDENKSLLHLGAKLDPNSTINRAANGSDKYNYVVDDNPDRVQRGRTRDRGMSFELFSFGLTADEPLPPTVSTHYGEFTSGRFIESNIFDPVSFTDGGIHEETALSKSRPISMILEENDEIELMNTPGFVEGPAPQSNCQLRLGAIQSVPNPVSSQLLFPHSSTTSITNNMHYGHSISNAEPLTVYSSTSMDLHAMPNTEDEFLMMQDDTAAASLLSQVLPNTLNGTVSHSTCPMELLNKDGRIGIYLPIARKERIAKFHSKRKMRIWRKRIKYDCRKKLADSRPRIKGRFVKSLEQDD